MLTRVVPFLCECSLLAPTSPPRLEGKEESPNLPSIENNDGPDRGLVKRLASWDFEGTKTKDIKPKRSCWWTKWQSSLTYFVRSWNTRFWMIWIMAWLSKYIGTGNDGSKDKSVRRRMSQVSSTTRSIMERYSTWAEERDMEVCFFDFQLIGEPPKLIKKPLTGLQESRQATQYASEKYKREKLGFELRKRPWVGFDLRY